MVIKFSTADRFDPLYSFGVVSKAALVYLPACTAPDTISGIDHGRF
jgi:hypothetical protein